MPRDLDPTPINFLAPQFQHRPIDGRTLIGEVYLKVQALVGDLYRMTAEAEDPGRRRGRRHLPRPASFLLGMFLESPWHCWAVVTCPRVRPASEPRTRRLASPETVLGSLRHRAWARVVGTIGRGLPIEHEVPRFSPRESTDLWPSVKESTDSLRALLRALTPTITKARALPQEWEHPAWQELGATVREHVQSLPNTLGVLAALPIELVDHTYGSPLLGRPSGIGAGPTPLTDFLRCSLRGTMRDAAIVALEDLLMDEEQFTRFLDGENLWRP